MKLAARTTTVFITLDTKHRTVCTTSGYRAEESASELASQISGTVGQYVRRGDAPLVQCGECGDTFPEILPEWDEVIPGIG